MLLESYIQWQQALLVKLYQKHNKCYRNHMFEIHSTTTIQRRKMKKESNALKESVKMKNNEQNLSMKKKTKKAVK